MVARAEFITLATVQIIPELAVDLLVPMVIRRITTPVIHIAAREELNLQVVQVDLMDLTELQEH